MNPRHMRSFQSRKVRVLVAWALVRIEGFKVSEHVFYLTSKKHGPSLQFRCFSVETNRSRNKGSRFLISLTNVGQKN